MVGTAETQTPHGEIKTAQLVACKRVCAALQNDRSRIVLFHNLLYHLPRKVEYLTSDQLDKLTGSKTLL
jgi:hypothetical protein